MKLWWSCPNCNKPVDFTKEMEHVFDEDGEADFDPQEGLWIHTIKCKCESSWIVSISEINK